MPRPTCYEKFWASSWCSGSPPLERPSKTVEALQGGLYWLSSPLESPFGTEPSVESQSGPISGGNLRIHAPAAPPGSSYKHSCQQLASGVTARTLSPWLYGGAINYRCLSFPKVNKTSDSCFVIPKPIMIWEKLCIYTLASWDLVRFLYISAYLAYVVVAAAISEILNFLI